MGEHTNAMYNVYNHDVNGLEKCMKPKATTMKIIIMPF